MLKINIWRCISSVAELIMYFYFDYGKVSFLMHFIVFNSGQLINKEWKYYSVNYSCTGTEIISLDMSWENKNIVEDSKFRQKLLLNNLSKKYKNYKEYYTRKWLLFISFEFKKFLVFLSKHLTLEKVYKIISKFSLLKDLV